MKPRALVKRFWFAWRRHGWRLFGPLVVHNLRHYGRLWLKGGEVGMPRSAVDDIPGVETQRAVYLTALGFSGDSGDDAKPYEPIADSDFQLLVDALPISPGDFTFVDLGSGKGRALLLAAKAGFRKVVGIEYSTALHEVAERNMLASIEHWPNVGRIELQCGDAAEYRPPASPVVCYLFNPFGAVVMSRVIETWSRSMLEHSSDVWVVYGNPEQISLFYAAPAFEYVFSVAGFAVFRGRR